MAKRYSVRLADELASRNQWTGTRRRTCTVGGAPVLLVFSRKPLLLDELPPEVAADTRLVVTVVDDSEPASKSKRSGTAGR